MEKKTVLITGIGGNVGQGIARNILNTTYPVRIVGTNITDFSAGNHLVDAFYKVPFGYDPQYIPTILNIIEKEKIDLIIPSTDFEQYYLSLHSKDFNCIVAGSTFETGEIYLDKYLTFLNHQTANIPFADSILPSKYSGQFSKALAKPRKGRGSKGLIFDIKDASHLDDGEYMVQEMHEGIEVTTAVYKRYTDNALHGIISLERTLENGATVFCKVNSSQDEQLLKIAESMCRENPGLKGSFNIQSIITSSGEVVPFEINCRISGTNSIRSGFGFKDVQYTIEELLWNITPETPSITNGVAYRYLSDVIYPHGESLKGNNTDNFKVF